MRVRPFKLPEDLPLIADVIINSFQYPENEKWSLQAEDRIMIANSLKKLRYMWPIVKISHFLSPKLKNMMKGFVWEQEGKLIGTIIIHKLGDTDTWLIGSIGVLPEYRRKGIARKLMNAGIDLILYRHGRRVILNVIEGNTPACSLYKSLGFKDYGIAHKFRISPRKSIFENKLPCGYSRSFSSIYDWKTRYELLRRITPPEIAKFEPVDKSRFQMPNIARLLKPLFLFVQGSKEYRINIRFKQNGKLVAQAGYSIQQRNTNKVYFNIYSDPGHPLLSPYIFNYLIHQIALINLNSKIEFSIPSWMPGLIETAEKIGANNLYNYRKMGLIF